MFVLKKFKVTEKTQGEIMLEIFPHKIPIINTIKLVSLINVIVDGLIKSKSK